MSKLFWKAAIMANGYNPQNPQGVQQYQQFYQQQYGQPVGQPVYPQQQPAQQVYRAVPVQQPVQYVAAAPQSDEVTTGDWMLSLFLAAIPLVGFILLLVWAFGSGTNPSKSNWAKATLLWEVIAIAVVLILSLTGVVGVGFLSAYYG